MNKDLTLDRLENLVREGEIDTILVAFPDHLGRLIGKRVTGSYFFDHMVANGMDACDYLLTVDIDMEPLPGFKMTSWESGYGDFHGSIDLATLRLIPWLEATALVLADLSWENGDPVAPSPRAILRHQLARADEKGLSVMMGSELEFYLFLEEHDELAERGFRNPKPTSQYIIDYHILATTRDESVIREIRNAMCEADIPVEFSKGEWGRGQHEINLRFSDALEMADRHVIYKNGVKEIAWARGHTATFMAKYDETEAGSSCHIHTSIFDKKGKKNQFWDEKKKDSSQLFRQFLGGMLAYAKEFSLFLAPTINSYKRYQPGTFAPTSIAWSFDNRTTGIRIIGHGASHRIENRIPGADANPYLAFAATIAAGLAGIEQGLDCGKPYKGDAYQATDLPRVPASLTESANHFENSDAARAAFGDDVVDHYVQLARLEQDAYNKAVTDWDRIRYFDRI